MKIKLRLLILDATRTPVGDQALRDLDLPDGSPVPLPGENITIADRAYQVAERAWAYESLRLSATSPTPDRLNLSMAVVQIAGPPHVVAAVAPPLLAN